MSTGVKIALLFLLLSLPGCSFWDYLQPPSRDPVTPQGELSEARELVYSFLHARVAGASMDDLRAYLTSEAWNDYQDEELTLQSTGNPGFVGYRLHEESKLTGGNFGFTVVMQKVIQQPLQTENAVEDLVVSFTEEEYRLSSARLLSKTRVRAEDGTLQWMELKNGEDGEPINLITLEEIPAEITGNSARSEPVGKEGYSTLILSPMERGTAFGTRGENGLLALLDWDDRNPAGEPEFIPVDLLSGETAGLMVFSPDARYLAVETLAGDERRRVLVYETEEVNDGTLLDLKLDRDFPGEIYNVVLKRWEPEGEKILIRVNPRWEGNGADPEKLGIWSVEILKGQKEKLLGR